MKRAAHEGMLLVAIMQSTSSSDSTAHGLRVLRQHLSHRYNQAGLSRTPAEENKFKATFPTLVACQNDDCRVHIWHGTYSRALEPTTCSASFSREDEPVTPRIYICLCLVRLVLRQIAVDAGTQNL